MSEFTAPHSEEDFERNFSPIKPLMNRTEAYFESSRCLFCYDAPCVKACPTGIDIPLFIRQIHNGNEAGAAHTIYDSNYFGYTCGKVCPVEVLCEGACVYNLQEVKPLEIGRLQSYATSSAIRNEKLYFKAGEKKNKKIAVVGAGPAGISCACELRKEGFEVDVFEAKKIPSGLAVHGIAPYKITNQEVLNEVRYLEKQFGFRIYFESGLTSPDDFVKLGQNYDAVFIGFGLGGTSRLSIEGEDKKNCYGAVEFIEQLRQNHFRMQVPENVIVLGGGNTAMDAASECARMGATVVLAYRRAKEEMGAYEFEYDLAKAAGVKGLFQVAPVRITGNEKAEGVEFVRTRTYNGNLETMPGTEFTLPCEWVIKATGQMKQTGLLSGIKGIEADKKGCIVVHDTSCQTGNPKFFAAGDAVSGGEEVVNAVAAGKKAAAGIITYLNQASGK
ncbi:MAG: FAD-dependent oxidoreductase [Bacteroidia bacterium]|nr:FAD-dependent oxidoreductase [Bacteroidia bacterium]